MNGLLLGCDEAVTAWAFQAHGKVPHHVDRAIGVLDGRGTLIGAALFHGYNSVDAILSYYGQDTATLGIGRSLAKIAISDLDLGRVTVVVSKKRKRLIRGLSKLGFRIEGVQRCYYGHRDCPRNTGVRLVMFREQIERYAGVVTERHPDAVGSAT